MKNSKHVFIALLAVLATGTASAQSMNKDSGYYGEVGYSAIKFSDTDASTTPKLVRLIVGTNINENLDVEGAIAFTASKDDVKGSTDGIKYSAQHVGFYAKPKIEIAKDTELFGRIGISRTTLKANGTNESTSDSFTKLAYGFGIQTQFTKDVYGQVDYMHLGKKDGVTAKGFTLSVGTRF